MKVLIAYASTEGQTRKIVEFIGNRVRDRNDEVAVFDTNSTLDDVDVNAFDKVILAGSVHLEKHQENLAIFVVAKREKLQARPSMFVSVSLAAAFADTKTEAERYIADFLAELGWQPTTVLTVAGAVRHGEYGYYREQLLEHFVLDGIHLDDIREDQEFTDWEALSKAVDAFLNA